MVIVSFICLSIFQLIKSRQYDISLVKDDYYVDDIGLEKLIQKRKNGLAVSGLTIKELSNEKILIVVPSSSIVKGKVRFLSPFSNKEDKTFDLKMVNDSMYLDLDNLRKGKWNIEIEWTDRVKEYLYQESIVLP